LLESDLFPKEKDEEKSESVIRTGRNLFDMLIKLNKQYEAMGVDALQNIIGRNNQTLRKTVANSFVKCQIGDFACKDFMFIGLFQQPNWITDLEDLLDG
jgi:hypothetical protein